MNVIHIISGGEKGGSKNHLISLLEEAKKNSMPNKLICLMDGVLYREAVSKGIDTMLICQKSRFDMSVIKKIKAILEKEKIDIVNCHGGRANFIGYTLKKICNKPKYVTTVHSDYREDYLGNSKKTIVFSNINAFVLRSFDYYITVSDSFRDMLISRGFKANRIFVVYNGIKFSEPVSYNKEEVKKSLGLNEKLRYIIMLARFHPVKGHIVLIEALKGLERSDFGIIMSGDGETYGYIKDLAVKEGLEDRIVFPGFVDPKEYLRASEFAVQPSYTESFPLSILEAAREGLTVISSEVGGIPALIEDGINGFLVKPKDAKALGDRISYLLDNENLCREMGKRLYSKASRKYSLEAMYISYQKIYNNIQSGGCSHE